MSNLRYGLILLLHFMGFAGVGQDLHQTNYQLNPLLLNPAKTGNYHGTFRIGAVYRDQYRPFIDKAFTTPAIFADSPMMYGFSKQHWIGLGFLFYQDEAGDLGYRTTGTHISTAYHMGLDQEFNNVLTIGIQYGSIKKEIRSGESAIFGDELTNPLVSSADRQFIEDYSKNFSDISAGIEWNSRISNRSGLQLGLSSMHLSRPDDVKGLIDLRWNVYGKFNYDISSRFQIEPTVYFHSVPTSRILNIQTNTRYRLKSEKVFYLTGGIGYRTDDAIQLLIGADINDWRIGVSYDLTVSQAAEATNSFGAIELGVNRIFKIFKEPQVDPIIFCPRF